MEFKIFRSDNASFLRITFPVTYKELSTVRNLIDINVVDEKGNALFSVLPSNGSVVVSTEAVAFPMSNQDKPIVITAQLDDTDDLSMRYFVALVKKGLSAYVANLQKASKEIHKLAEGVEIE